MENRPENWDEIARLIDVTLSPAFEAERASIIAGTSRTSTTRTPARPDPESVAASANSQRSRAAPDSELGSADGGGARA